MVTRFPRDGGQSTFGGVAWRRLGPRAGGLLLILLGLGDMLRLTLPLVGIAMAAVGGWPSSGVFGGGERRSPEAFKGDC